jgi:hypothetical protein
MSQRLLTALEGAVQGKVFEEQVIGKIWSVTHNLGNSIKIRFNCISAHRKCKLEYGNGSNICF